MVVRDIMVKILELKSLEKELTQSCSSGCQSCRTKIHERISNLIAIIGKDVIENPQFLKSRDYLVKYHELKALENMLCDLCHKVCGECKVAIDERVRELCELLENECDNCPCK